MTNKQAHIIMHGLFHDGIDVDRLTPKARAEIRAAADAVLAAVK